MMRERKVTPVEIRAGSHRRLDIGWFGGGRGRGDWGERGAVEGALVSVGREGGGRIHGYEMRMRWR